MNYFLAGVACSASLFLIFRSFEKYKIHTFYAIVINYWVCVITGTAFLGDLRVFGKLSMQTPWLSFGIGLGALFVATFYLMGYTAQKISVSASSTSSKVSFVLPVLFSLFVLKTSQKSFDFINYLGLCMIILAIWLTSSKKREPNASDSSTSGWLLTLPFAIFIMSGAIDTLVAYVSSNLVKEAWEIATFPIVLFVVAGILGTLVLVFFQRGVAFSYKNIVAGVVLGIPNYFSVYFLFKALALYNNNGAVLFPLFNVSVILLSTLLAILFFKERLSNLNKMGVGIAVLAILAITYQELF